jgi:hypothetical protein
VKVNASDVKTSKLKPKGAFRDLYLKQYRGTGLGTGYSMTFSARGVGFIIPSQCA